MTRYPKDTTKLITRIRTVLRVILFLGATGLLLSAGYNLGRIDGQEVQRKADLPVWQIKLKTAYEQGRADGIDDCIHARQTLNTYQDLSGPSRTAF